MPRQTPRRMIPSPPNTMTEHQRILPIRRDYNRLVADETLDISEAAAEGGATDRGGLAGESVLLAALNASRTGRMTDIVRTIQAE